MSLTPDKELLILEALRVKVAAVAGAHNVIANEPLLDSKQDVLDTICIQNIEDETEVVYIKIDFLTFEDSPDEGCEDDPLVKLSYNLHVFQQYKEIRQDNSTSTQDIKNLVLNLRNEFLKFKDNARQLLPDCETTPLKPNNFILLDNDPLTGVYGHFADLICKVELL